MIVKNLTRKQGTGQLLRYILRYVISEEKQLANSEKTLIIRHNVRNRTVEGYIKEFKENEKRRINKRKGQIVVNHTILSWSKRDAEKLNDSTLKRIAREYVKLRGENNLYVISKHTDREHIHLHCAMSATQLDGSSNRLTKSQFASLKLELDQFQKSHFPELVNSLPEHGRLKAIKERARESQDWKCGRKADEKAFICDVEEVFKESKSSEDFVCEEKIKEKRLVEIAGLRDRMMDRSIDRVRDRQLFDDTEIGSNNSENDNESMLLPLAMEGFGAFPIYRMLQEE